MKFRTHLTTAYEQKKIREGFSFVVGCDEVGRGCLAGPVVAAAVILDLSFKIKDLRESKELSAKQRELFDGVLRKHAVGWGIGVVSEKEIDEINIHNASLLAMRQAVESLLSAIPVSGPEISSRREILNRVQNDKVFVVVDGKFSIPAFHMKQEAVVGGDAKILSVAAASIIAKVYRDKLMSEYHVQYPDYNFAQHKGYATFHHRNAVKLYGPCPIHRKSFQVR